MKRLLTALTIISLIASTFTPALAAPSMDKSREKEIGKQAEREVKREYDIVDDYYARQYVAGLAAKLATAMDAREFDIRVHIIKSPVVNAFTIPGGIIFLTSGIIFAMENEEELAGVLAHEMGHAEARHIATRADKASQVGIVSAAAIVAGMLIGTKFDPKLGQAAMAFGIGGANAAILSYSRADETEADHWGAEALDKSGIGNSGLISFMEKLARISPVPETFPAYLLTHPMPSERASFLKSSTLPKKEALSPSSTYFWTLQARVAAMDPRPWALTMIEKRADANPLSFQAQLSNGVLSRALGNYSDAEEKLERALTISPDNPEALHELALVELYTGRSDKGLERLRKLRNSGRAGFPALRDLGWVCLEKNLGEEALSVYDEIKKNGPEWNELPLRRGIALGKAGREPEAHLELGRYYLDRDPATARNHLQKAINSLADPKKREEAEALLERLNHRIKSEENARDR